MIFKKTKSEIKIEQLKALLKETELDLLSDARYMLNLQEEVSSTANEKIIYLNDNEIDINNRLYTLYKSTMYNIQRLKEELSAIDCE